MGEPDDGARRGAGRQQRPIERVENGPAAGSDRENAEPGTVEPAVREVGIGAGTGFGISAGTGFGISAGTGFGIGLGVTADLRAGPYSTFG